MNTPWTKSKCFVWVYGSWLLIMLLCCCQVRFLRVYGCSLAPHHYFKVSHAFHHQAFIQIKAKLSQSLLRQIESDWPSICPYRGSFIYLTAWLLFAAIYRPEFWPSSDKYLGLISPLTHPSCSLSRLIKGLTGDFDSSMFSASGTSTFFHVTNNNVISYSKWPTFQCGSHHQHVSPLTNRWVINQGENQRSLTHTVRGSGDTLSSVCTYHVYFF